eukprot:TRINITY_DN2555_c0_g1_i6.p2 TRINITY_DN2555_c0_g1~~TRINITY_DN2555_c0_g1_i6.p2  ORF type:complete len:184 (-),score=43.99 TRINITY_DN2555_c0_g1_i6:87-638(-)
MLRSLVGSEMCIRDRYWFSPENEFVQYQKGDILQWWGTDKALAQALEKMKDQKFVLNNNEHLYLDCGVGNLYGDGTWCGSYKTWKTIYEMPLLESKQIIGAVVSLFGELVNDQVVDSTLWPRTSSLSEVVWSQKRDKLQRNVVRRLGAQALRLLQRGVNSKPITSQACQRDVQSCFKNFTFKI